MANPNPSPSTRFKPGQSGNARGGPKGPRTLTAILRAAVEREVLDKKGKPTGRTKGDELIAALLDIALNGADARGDRQTIRDIFDRLDGKTPDRVITENPGDQTMAEAADSVEQKFVGQPGP